VTDQLARDLSYSVRGLARDRVFVMTTVSTLAVSLALVTIVFAIFNAYVLRPYAVRDPYSGNGCPRDRSGRRRVLPVTEGDANRPVACVTRGLIELMEIRHAHGGC
jgi:hypothetical protein